VILGGGFYFLAANSHFDVFPCEKAYYSFSQDRLEPKAGSTCSLLDIKRSGDGPRADFAELTGGGYAVAVLLFVFLPYLVAAGIGHTIQRKKKK
jgi:hypothetical protein